jgi:hypothetical protein
MEVRRARIYWRCQIAGWFTYLGLWLLPAICASDPALIAPGRLVLGSACQAVISIAWTHAAVRRPRQPGDAARRSPGDRRALGAGGGRAMRAVIVDDERLARNELRRAAMASPCSSGSTPRV